jgi:hypothetical protein
VLLRELRAIERKQERMMRELHSKRSSSRAGDGEQVGQTG